MCAGSGYVGWSAISPTSRCRTDEISISGRVAGSRGDGGAESTGDENVLEAEEEPEEGAGE